MRINDINQKQIVTVAVLALAAFLALNTYQIQKKQIEQARDRVIEQEKKNASLTHIGKVKAITDTYKEKFKAREAQEIIKTITGLAADLDIKIVSLKPAQDTSAARVKKGQYYNKALFNLLIEAENYHALGRFISGLENASIIFLFESAGVKSVSESSRQGDSVKTGVLPESLSANLVISEVSFRD